MHELRDPLAVGNGFLRNVFESIKVTRNCHFYRKPVTPRILVLQVMSLYPY